jgi:hypothetical protein
MVDAPAFDVRTAAYLLPCVVAQLAKGTVCLVIVDPGVGGTRKPIVLEANERWFIGPDNGLFELLVRQSEAVVGSLIGLKQFQSAFMVEIFSPRWPQ